MVDKRLCTLLLIIVASTLIGCSQKEVPTQPTLTPTQTENVTKPKQMENIFIETNPNVELISIVYSMTTFNYWRIPDYADYAYWNDVRDKFSQYNTHPAVKNAQKLVDLGFAWDAPYNLILHYSHPPKLQKSEEYSNQLVERIGRSGVDWLIDDFVNSLRDFACESNFEEFYTNHSPIYNQSIEKVKSKTSVNNQITWAEHFYGDRAEEYHIVLAHGLYGGGGFTVPVGDKVYMILRISDIKNGKPVFVTDVDSFNLTVLWLVSYYFLDKCVDENRKDMESLSYLYADYGNWLKNLRDSYILAFLAYSIEDYSGLKNAENFLNSKMGYLYATPKIWETYHEYKSNRDKYPNFCSFFPETIKALKDIPYVVSTYPQKGAVLDANEVSEIVVRFSEPISQKSYAFVTSKNGEYPETTGKPYFINSTTVVLPVKLKPSTNYALFINLPPKYAGFKDLDGNPVAPYELVFKTK